MALFHMRCISSRLFMVFDFSSSNCRFASTPAVFTSLFTRLSSASITAARPLALGRRGALLGCAGVSPGVEAAWAVRGVLPSDDRVASSALAGRLPGRTRGGGGWVSGERAGSGAVARRLVSSGDETIRGRCGAGGVTSGRGVGAVLAGSLTDSGHTGGADSGLARRPLGCGGALGCGPG